MARSSSVKCDHMPARVRAAAALRRRRRYAGSGRRAGSLFHLAARHQTVTASSAAAPSQLQVGSSWWIRCEPKMARSSLADFVLGPTLGSGSFGSVYKVTRKQDR